jgi:hypothetical protein
VTGRSKSLHDLAGAADPMVFVIDDDVRPVSPRARRRMPVLRRNTCPQPARRASLQEPMEGREGGVASRDRPERTRSGSAAGIEPETRSWCRASRSWPNCRSRWSTRSSTREALARPRNPFCSSSIRPPARGPGRFTASCETTRTRRSLRVRHSEMPANLLIEWRSNSRDFSECALINNANYVDFDSVVPNIVRARLRTH